MSFVINSRFNSNILVVDFITACHQISPSLHNQLFSSKLKPKPVKNCLSYVFLCHQDEIEKQKKKLSSNTHDWYCWECHKAGEVIACEYCPRVFHRKCAHSGTVANGKWKCPSCQVISNLFFLCTGWRQSDRGYSTGLWMEWSGLQLCGVIVLCS